MSWPNGSQLNVISVASIKEQVRFAPSVAIRNADFLKSRFLLDFPQSFLQIVYVEHLLMADKG